MIESNLLDDFFPYAILLAFLCWSYLNKRQGNDVDEELRDLNARLDHIQSQYAERLLDAMDRTCEHYTSTACHHANDDDDTALHGQCRRHCKFCGAPCRCECHLPPEHFLQDLDKPEYDTVERLA